MAPVAIYRESGVAAWTFSTNRSVVATIRDDCHVTLVNFENKSTCVLDDAGMRIWSHLAEGCSAMEIVRKLRTRTATPLEDIKNIHAVSAILLQLLREEMIFPNWCWEPRASRSMAQAQ